MSTRRDVLKQIGAAAVAGSALTSATTAAAATTTSPDPADPADATPLAHPTDAPWTLLAPYQPGHEVGGWTLQRLSAVTDGATVLTLSSTGQQARVHICEHGGDPRGLAHTDRFDLLLMNGGDGGTPSQEDLARTLVALAAAIGANTEDALAAHPELAGLLTHEERVDAFARCGREVMV